MGHTLWNYQNYGRMQLHERGTQNPQISSLLRTKCFYIDQWRAENLVMHKRLHYLLSMYLWTSTIKPYKRVCSEASVPGIHAFSQKYLYFPPSLFGLIMLAGGNLQVKI